ncbi:MAG: hypothetical protein K2X27_05410 [Candidatus Obscuribacterales bacterium]|nr:hypothetical protein [Candidatus Obscuribacterales bacterium]
MYHLHCKKLVLSLLAIVTSSLVPFASIASEAKEIVLSSPLNGGSSNAAPLTSEVAVTVPSSYTLPPSKNELKHPPTTVEIYQYDEAPIGNRQPLLMVHGLRGEFREGFRWEMVVSHLMNDAKFRQKYKVYFARFNTYVLVDTVKPHFKQALLDLSRSTGNKPVTIMALSLGGSLVQAAMADPAVEAAVDKVLTLGTPFHGAPLFCFDWLRYSIIRNHDVPWVRADLCLSYKLYFRLHPNLLEDLRWDNSDGGIPQLGKFSTWFPFHVTGDVDRQRMSNARILRLNEEIKIDKKKFICYGGYLLTPYVTPHQSTRFWKAVRWPYWFLTCTVPYHMGFEHPVLRALNYEMGRMVVASAEDDKKAIRGSDRYGLNDGITPLVSALFLPSKTLAENPIDRESTISSIRRNIDVQKARVFRQIDHITFVDGYRPRGLPEEMRDELAPELGSRTIFDWMLIDLMDNESQLAETSEKPTPEVKQETD